MHLLSLDYPFSHSERAWFSYIIITQIKEMDALKEMLVCRMVKKSGRWSAAIVLLFILAYNLWCIFLGLLKWKMLLHSSQYKSWFYFIHPLLHSSRIQPCLMAFITWLQTHNLSNYVNVVSNLCVYSYLKIVVYYIVSDYLRCALICPFFSTVLQPEICVNVQITWSNKCVRCVIIQNKFTS